VAGKLWVFDLDNTIRFCGSDYEKPAQDAAKYIHSLLKNDLGKKAPSTEEIITVAREIDRKRVNEINPKTGTPFLYCMDRFPGSQVETFHQLCQKYNINPGEAADSEIAGRLLKIGLRAFSEELFRSNIAPRAKEVLKFLRDQDDTLVIYTKGDNHVQNLKLKVLKKIGVIPQDTNACVQENKHADTFRHLALLYPSRKRFVVGDTYKADIQPALSLNLGYKSILIPAENWEEPGQLEKTLAEVDRQNCRIFKDLGQIVDQYREL